MAAKATDDNGSKKRIGGKKHAQRSVDSAGAEKAPYPGFVEPALATLQSRPPSGANWLHEIKLDGYWLQAHIRSGRVNLLTRRGFDWTARFGKTLANALQCPSIREAIIDGEVVVEGAGNVPDFSALQDALATGRTERLIFYAFDLGTSGPPLPCYKSALL